MIKNENENLNDPFKVYVRIRPFLEKEIGYDKPGVVVQDKIVSCY